MREIVSMKETTIAFVTFFMTIFFLVQIKFIRKLRKLRKENERIIPDGLFVESVWDVIEIVLIIIGGFFSIIFLIWICKDTIDKGKLERKKTLEESYEEKVPSEKRKRKYEAYMKKIKQEKSRIKELTKGKEETNIWWISFTAKVPKEKIIEIFEEDPDFIIENGVVYNKELTSKEELQNVRKRKERRERIAKGICPECEVPFEIGEISEVYCKNCGEMFEVESESIIEMQEEEQALLQEATQESSTIVKKKHPISQNKFTILTDIIGFFSLFFTFAPFDFSKIYVYIHIIFATIAIIFGIIGTWKEETKVQSVIGIIMGVISASLWLVGCFTGEGLWSLW
jgi:hypothetical protein